MEALFVERSLIPIVVIDEVSKAVPLAEALLAGGIASIEITLRTEAGLPAIEAIANAVPDMLIGSGTVLNSERMQQAHDAGARFHVSPGFTESLAQFARSKDMQWLPGVANASQVMQAMEAGYTHLKLFPACISGGAALLKQFASVFSGIAFCPTGGVSMDNMHDYTALANVFAIGGSWLAPKEAMQAGDWQCITRIAEESLSVLRADR